MGSPPELRVEYFAHTETAYLQPAADNDWILFYSANGSCELLLDSQSAYRLPTRHMLLVDAHQLSHCRIESNNLFICHQFSFYGMANLVAEWQIQFGTLIPMQAFNGERIGSLMLVDTEHENIHATLSEIIDEQGHNKPLRDLLLKQLLTLLMLKLARSQQAHYRATGIYYIKRAKQFITSHSDNDLPVQMIADDLGIHRSYLQVLFKKYTGHSIVDYVNHVRVGKAMLLLSTTNRPIIDISIAVGFNNRQHFTRTFIKYAGRSPSEYRQKKISSEPSPSDTIGESGKKLVETIR